MYLRLREDGHSEVVLTNGKTSNLEGCLDNG